jgi:hypothetical protein
MMDALALSTAQQSRVGYVEKRCRTTPHSDTEIRFHLPVCRGGALRILKEVDVVQVTLLR